MYLLLKKIIKKKNYFTILIDMKKNLKRTRFLIILPHNFPWDELHLFSSSPPSSSSDPCLLPVLLQSTHLETAAMELSASLLLLSSTPTSPPKSHLSLRQFPQLRPAITILSQWRAKERSGHGGETSKGNLGGVLIHQGFYFLHFFGFFWRLFAIPISWILLSLLDEFDCRIVCWSLHLLWEFTSRWLLFGFFGLYLGLVTIPISWFLLSMLVLLKFAVIDGTRNIEGQRGRGFKSPRLSLCDNFLGG